MTVTNETTQIPVRLDFDGLAAGFARAMAHLDQAATGPGLQAPTSPDSRGRGGEPGAEREGHVSW